jgi:O-antigen chain-terminating methyltransferase
MLELLRDRGVEAVGVDLSAGMVASAREKGLAMEHGDVFTWLAERPPGSLGGILCSHVVEHLWPADHVRLAHLCVSALREGGVLIVETPNPKSLIAGSVNFSCDPTHLRPVFPETLAFILEAAGFVDVAIEYLAPVPDDHRATPVTDVPEGLEATFAQLNTSIARLDALVFGERDYAVVARAGGLGTGPDAGG